MSLKALAEQRLAALRGDETTPETMMKQVKQGGETCFTEAPSVSPPMKHANPQKTAKNRPCFTVSPTRAGNGETSSLPVEIEDGLRRLRSMPTPPISLPPAWPEIVADAARLDAEGWAQRALGLGWEPLDLFGCWSKGEDQPGLAVWLAGRHVLLLDESCCIVDAGGGSHMIYTRRAMDGAIYLWDFGSAVVDPRLSVREDACREE